MFASSETSTATDDAIGQLRVCLPFMNSILSGRLPGSRVTPRPAIWVLTLAATILVGGTQAAAGPANPLDDAQRKHGLAADTTRGKGQHPDRRSRCDAVARQPPGKYGFTNGRHTRTARWRRLSPWMSLSWRT